MANLTEAFRQRQLFRMLRGVMRYAEERLPQLYPNYRVFGRIEEEAGVWTLEITVRPKLGKELKAKG